MSTVAKVGVVIGGYFLAVPAAIAVVILYGRLFPNPDSSGGMAAFSDLLLFLVTFAALAFVPTGLALYWTFMALSRRRTARR